MSIPQGDFRPRVLTMRGAHPIPATQAAWEAVVRARHGGTDPAAALQPYAHDMPAVWERDARNDPQAACLAGDCRLLGVGTAPDRSAAESYYRIAVELGEPTAMTNLAELLEERRADAVAGREATELLRRAALAGDARAQGLLGKRYIDGTDVERDEALARRWFEQGTEGDDARSQNNLAALLLDGEPTEAEHLLRRAAGHGLAIAMVNLARILWEPRVPNRGADYPQALEWFRRAAACGNAAAQERLGEIYAFGENVPQDEAEARRWFLAAARQGRPHAQVNLGVLFEHGRGGPASIADAELWFRRAADAGNPIAQRYHADLCRRRENARAASRSTPRKRRSKEWVWAHDWKLLVLSLPNTTDVVLEVREDEAQTEGRAGFGSRQARTALREFLTVGPPTLILEHVEPSLLVSAFEQFFAESGREEPQWLNSLRVHEAAAVCSPDVLRDRLARFPYRRLGGFDPLYWAVRTGRVEAIRELLAVDPAAANATYPDRFGPTLTPLMLAARDLPEESAACVFAALRAGGADLEARNDHGETALLWLLGSAASNGIRRAGFWEWLSAAGANPNAQVTGSGKTALSLVTTSRFRAEIKMQLVRQLFDAGATVQAMSDADRDAFRTALASWGPDAWSIGMSLRTRPNLTDYLTNLFLIVHDRAADFESIVWTVGRQAIANMPYAPDEAYSFRASLYRREDRLIVGATRIRRVLDEVQEEEAWFVSSDRGRRWDRSERPSLADAVLLSTLGEPQPTTGG